MPKFNFLNRPHNSTLVTWADGHAVIHDAEQAQNLAAASIPGVSEAARAYLDKFHPEAEQPWTA